jgi:hypothetical protein
LSHAVQLENFGVETLSELNDSHIVNFETLTEELGFTHAEVARLKSTLTIRMPARDGAAAASDLRNFYLPGNMTRNPGINTVYGVHGDQLRMMSRTLF